MYPRSIYEITHLATGRKYVGSSTDVTKRWKKHLWELQKGIHPVEAMQRDYDRLGKEYSFAIIGQIADESEDHKEYDCMIERESNIRGRGYNYKDRKCPKKSSIELEKEVLEKIRNSSDPEKALRVAMAASYFFLLEQTIKEITGIEVTYIQGDGECRIVYG